jgi:hypothetical protein
LASSLWLSIRGGHGAHNTYTYTYNTCNSDPDV